MAFGTLVGYIPEKLVYIHRNEKIKVYPEWECGIGYIGKPEKVIPAFVSDATNKKTIETGERWAGGWNYNTNAERNKPHKLELDNKPLAGLRILELVRRSEGGRAYKVMSTDGWYFDLREDVLLDTITTVGIDAGGVLRGEYVWARVRSEMKLVRVGSDLHTKLTELTSRKGTLKDLKLDDLVVGGVYATRTKTLMMFLGVVSTTRLEPDKATKKQRYWGTDRPVVLRKQLAKAGLWYEIPAYENKEDRAKLLKKALKDGGVPWYFAVKQTAAVVELVQTVEVPADVVEQVRNNALAGVEARRKERARYTSPYSRSYTAATSVELDRTQVADVCYYSDLALMRKAEETDMPVPAEFKCVIDNYVHNPSMTG